VIPDILKTLYSGFIDLMNLRGDSIACRVAVVVGSNACGKSLLRRAIVQKLHYDEKLFVAHFSQEARSKGGFERAFVYGSEDDESTGYLTISSLLKNFRQDRDKPWVTVCDEPEIGLSEESQIGLGIWLRDRMAKDMPNLLGMVVVTHSRHVVSALSECDGFRLLDLDGKHNTEWLDRDIVPVSPQQIKDRGQARWHEFSGYFNRRREEKKDGG